MRHNSSRHTRCIGCHNGSWRQETYQLYIYKKIKHCRSFLECWWHAFYIEYTVLCVQHVIRCFNAFSIPPDGTIGLNVQGTAQSHLVAHGIVPCLLLQLVPKSILCRNNSRSGLNKRAIETNHNNSERDWH